jgi:ribbon-helix-helix CopG family protein
LLFYDITKSVVVRTGRPKLFRKGVKIMKTMIYLEESAHLRLKHLAVDERVSMAELVRRAVSDYLEKHSKKGGSRK